MLYADRTGVELTDIRVRHHQVMMWHISLQRVYGMRPLRVNGSFGSRGLFGDTCIQLKGVVLSRPSGRIKTKPGVFTQFRRFVLAGAARCRVW